MQHCSSPPACRVTASGRALLDWASRRCMNSPSHRRAPASLGIHRSPANSICASSELPTHSLISRHPPLSSTSQFHTHSHNSLCAGARHARATLTHIPSSRACTSSAQWCLSDASRHVTMVGATGLGIAWWGRAPAHVCPPSREVAQRSFAACDHVRNHRTHKRVMGTPPSRKMLRCQSVPLS